MAKRKHRSPPQTRKAKAKAAKKKREPRQAELPMEAPELPTTVEDDVTAVLEHVPETTTTEPEKPSQG